MTKFSAVAAMKAADMQFLRSVPQRPGSAFRTLAHAIGTREQVSKVVAEAKLAGWQETYMGMVKAEDGRYLLVYESPIKQGRGERFAVSVYD